MSTPQSNEIHETPPDFIVKIWHGANFFGTGVLLRDNLVLTAAHCINPDFKSHTSDHEFNGPFTSKGVNWYDQLEIELSDGTRVVFQNGVGKINGNYTHDIVLIEILNSEFKLSTRVQLLGNIGSEEWNAQVTCSRAYAVGHRPNSEQGADYMCPQVQVQPCPNTNARGAVNFSFNTSLVSGQSGSGIVVPNLKRNGYLILGIACLSGRGVNFCNCCGHADILALLTDDSGPFSKAGLVSTWTEFFRDEPKDDRPELFDALKRLLKANDALLNRLYKAFPQSSGTEVSGLAQQLVEKISFTMQTLKSLIDEKPAPELAEAILSLADVALPCAIPMANIGIQHRPDENQGQLKYERPMQLSTLGNAAPVLLEAIVAAVMDRRVRSDHGTLDLIAPASDKPDEPVRQILAQLWHLIVPKLEGGRKSNSGDEFARQLLSGNRSNDSIDSKRLVEDQYEAIREELEAEYERKTPRYVAPQSGDRLKQISDTLSAQQKLLLLLFEIPDPVPTLSDLRRAASHYQALRETKLK